MTATLAPVAPSQITIIGSLNMDLVAYVEHHPLPGETLKALSYVQAPGGKGANQAVACAKLSRQRSAAKAACPSTTPIIRMIGVVGNDAYGPVLRAHLAACGVDVSGVAVCPADDDDDDNNCKTGVAIVLVDARSGQNRIVLAPGSNDALRPAQFAAGLPGPRPDLLILQLEIPLATILAVLETARDAPGGPVPVLLNAAPALPALPSEAYAGLAHLVVNETEAALLAGMTAAALNTEAGLHAAADAFLARGVRTVIITLGGRGVFYAATTTTEGNPRTTGLVPAEKTTVVDTTAAGDTFVGAYALAVVRAQKQGVAFDLAAAVRTANHAAAKTVAKKGAQEAIPWQDEL